MPKEDTQQADLPLQTAAPIQGPGIEQRTSRPRTEWERLLQSRKFILMILFFVTGALGLPLLWISSAFSTTEKILWSLANVVYTLALIALCVAICLWAYSRILTAI